MGNETKDKSGLIAKWRASRRSKRERTGPSAEAVHEERNADKNFDPAAVARNADKMFPR